MAWTTPRCWTTGEVVTAALLNAQIKGNMDLTAPAKLTTAGDMLYATGANATARLAKGTNGNIMHQASCAPAWTACPSIAGITLSGALDANGTVDADVTDFDVLSSGDIDLVSSANAAAAVYIAQSTGTSGTVKIHADTGTSVTEGAESINILSDVGGVGIRSTANLANAVNITADGGTTSTIQIFNDQGTAVNEGVASIQLLSDVGGIGIKSGLNAAGAIRLTADAGTSETIMLHADQGSGTGSICLTSDAGGITLNPGTFVTVGGIADGEIRIMEDSGAGTNYAAIKVQNMGASYTLTLPADDGCCGEFLKTNGSGVLDWATAGGGGASALQVNDCVAFAAGTGSDSKIYYDGTDTHWDLRDTGTGDLIIALEACHPSPDPQSVHIWAGSAGSVVAPAIAALIIEDNANTGLAILSPSSTGGYIYFGDESCSGVGGLIYSHGCNHIVVRAGGATEYTFGTASADFNNNTLLNVGDAGNDWTANSVVLEHDADSAQLKFGLYNTSCSGSGTAAFKTRTKAGTGDAYIEFEITSGGQFLMGIDNSADSGSDLFALGGHGQGLGGNDAFRVNRASPAQFSLNTGQGSDFDYVCQNCGKHSLEPFVCCGVVEWHDDVLALRKASVDLATMSNPYEPGQSLNVAHLVKLGIMDYDSDDEDVLATRATPWLGLNISNAQMFTWAGMWQTRELVDNNHACHETRIKELEAKLGGCSG